MSKAQLLSFEKNNYYYGKLLTVRDFQLEQQYGVAKRQLINRLVIGTGVVGGLQVDKVGGRGIRITPGVAIDGNGAEIVVSREVVHSDIKELNGYPLEGEGNKTVYLALSYEECTREPIPALANTSSCEEVCEANRIVETFKAELTSSPPSEEAGLCGLLEEATILYQGTKVKLERIVPGYVSPGDAFEIIVRLTALQPIAATDSLELQLFETVPDSFSVLKPESIRFVLDTSAAGTVWEKQYTLRAGGQTGSGIVTGKLRLHESGTSKTIDVPGSSIGIIDHQALQRKIVELAFNRQAENGDSGEKGGVIIAALTIDNEGLITNIDEAVRSYVYNNKLLSQLTACGDSRSGKLPEHAHSHQFGGSDPLNVDNLPGELADPQKVMVYTEGDSYVEAKRFSFSGSGVTVKQAGDDHVAITIAGGTGGGGTGGPHESSHRAGGTDELYVGGLSGVLKEPQKVSVAGTGSDGNQIYLEANRILFEGGVVSENDGSAHVQIPHYEVLTGSVRFDNLSANVINISAPIRVDAKGKAIVFYFETSTGVATGNDISGYVAWASFEPGSNVLRIYSKHTQAGRDLTWKVRYFLIPATGELGEVGSSGLLT